MKAQGAVFPPPDSDNSYEATYFKTSSKPPIFTCTWASNELLAQIAAKDAIKGAIARLEGEQARRLERRRIGVVKRTWRRAWEGAASFALWLGLPPIPPPRRFGFRWLLKGVLKGALFALVLVLLAALVLAVVYPDVPDEL